jgi:hypothetical protein
MKTEGVETGISRSVWINCLVMELASFLTRPSMDTVTRGDKLFAASVVHFDAIPTGWVSISQRNKFFVDLLLQRRTGRTALKNHNTLL